MITKTNFKDLFIVKNKSFKDKRGYFKELARENKISKKFPFHVMSYSKKKCHKRSTYSNKRLSRKIYFSNKRKNF